MSSRIRRGTPEWYVSQTGQRSREFSEVEASLYRFRVRPSAPDSGIENGYVIAYGHLLARPYRFEVLGDSLLLINGIQITPRLTHPAYDSAAAVCRSLLLDGVPRVPREYVEATGQVDHALFVMADRIRAGGDLTREAVTESTWTALRSFDFVDTAACCVSVEVEGDRAVGAFVTYGVCILRDDEPAYRRKWSTQLVFDTKHEWALPGRGSPTAAERRTALMNEATADSWHLEEGALLVYGVHGSGTFPGDRVRRSMSRIDSSSTTWSATYDAFLDLNTGPGSVKELAYNFDWLEYAWVLSVR
ncbi:MAG: hypothetical protein R6X13_04800 [bacterium]